MKNQFSKVVYHVIFSGLSKDSKEIFIKKVGPFKQAPQMIANKIFSDFWDSVQSIPEIAIFKDGFWKLQTGNDQYDHMEIQADVPIELNEVEQKLVDFAQTIKHCGDYGLLWWNSGRGSVVLTLGDGDGDPSHGTSFQDIKKGFKLIPEVKDVDIADEWYPEEKEGYRYLGTCV